MSIKNLDFKIRRKVFPLCSFVFPLVYIFISKINLAKFIFFIKLDSCLLTNSLSIVIFFFFSLKRSYVRGTNVRPDGRKVHSFS
jgi:hypothetical protein